MTTILPASGIRVLWVLGVVLAVVALPVHPLSNDFAALQREVDYEYFRPRGLTLLGVQESEPLLLSGAMGHALRHQYLIAQGNRPRLDYLRKVVEPEVAGYMNWLAERFGNLPSYRFQDGRPIGGPDLLENFVGALNGKDDGWFSRQFGITHATPPLALPVSPVQATPAVAPETPRPSPQPMDFFPPPQPAAAPQGNAIDLLGNVAPRQNRQAIVSNIPQSPSRPSQPVAKEPGVSWECRRPGTVEGRTVWWKIVRSTMTTPAICFRPGAFAPSPSGCTAKGQYLCCESWPGGSPYYAEGRGSNCSCVTESQFTKVGCAER